MLDGQTFVCLARTINKRIGDYSSPETFFSIGLVGVIAALEIYGQ